MSSLSLRVMTPTTSIGQPMTPDDTANNATDASPVTVALDTVGNIWTTSTGTTATPPNKAGLTYIVSPLAAVHSGKTTIQTYGDYVIPDGIAIDASDPLAAARTALGFISEFKASAPSPWDARPRKERRVSCWARKLSISERRSIIRSG